MSKNIIVMVKPNNTVKIVAKAKEIYQVEMATTGKSPQDITATKDGNHLRLTSKKQHAELIIEDFYKNCADGDACMVALDYPTLGTGLTEILPESIIDSALSETVLASGAMDSFFSPLLLGISTLGLGGVAYLVSSQQKTISDVNHAPAAIQLSNSIVAHHIKGAVIGNLTTTDPDVGDTHTYTVSDARFEVVGGQLKLKAGMSLDYEATSTVTVTVTSTDSGNLKTTQDFVITVNNVNEAPTAIQLTNKTVDENAVGAIIGNLTTTDPDVGDTHTYTVSDARFEVVGGQLKLKAGMSLDYEAASTVTVTVTSTDSGNLKTTQDFVITVNNVNEAPTAIQLTNKTVDENAVGAIIGNLTTTDPDVGDTHTYTVSDARFEVVGGQLKLKAGVSLDYEATSTVAVTVTSTDSGNLKTTQDFVITVNNVNEAPTAIQLTNKTVDENAVGAIIGNLTTTDPDVGDTHTYTVSDARFEVVGGQLKLKAGMSLDYEAASTVAVTVTSKDAAGLTASQAFNIVVNDILETSNQAPTAIQLTNKTVDENAVGAIIGNLTTTDPDVGDTHTYTVSDARFEVVGGQLKLKAGMSLDYEAASTVTVTVTSTDSGNLKTTQDFVITVNNVNEAPTAIQLTNKTVDENAVGAIIGNLTTTDPDVGDTHTYTVSDARFEVVGGQLKLKAGVSLDYEATSTVAVTVTSTDSGNLKTTQDFVITVNNVNEAPTAIQLTNKTVDENAVGAIIGNLTTTDPDVGDTHTYTVSDARFEVVGGQLKLKAGMSLDYEAASTVTVTVTSTDSGNLKTTQDFVITVNNLDEVAPTITSGATVSIDENSGAGQVVYTATSTDTGDIAIGSTVYSLKAGSDEGLTINSSTGKVTLASNPDYETKSAYSFTVVATDTANNSSEKAVSLSINNINEGPTLVSVFPADDMSKVLKNENIVLDFNENVLAGVGSIKIVNANDATDTRIISITSSEVHISGHYVTVNPTNDLKADATYYVTVDATAIKNNSDIYYEGINNSSTLNFSTVTVRTGYVDPGDSSPLIGIEDSSDKKWGDVLGQGVTLSYSFATSTTNNSYESGSKTVTSVLDDIQKNSFRSALHEWSAMANLNFVEVPDTGAGTGGIIRVAFADIGTSHGSAFYPTTHYTGGDIWLGQHYRDNTTYFTVSPTDPLGGMQTMIHEAGHALALAHPNDDPDDTNYTKLETIMSYNTQDHSYIYLLDGTDYRVYDRTPMIMDIAAIQTLYGANMAYNNTDTVYTFEHDDPFFMSIWDAGGVDTIDIANFTKDSAIDLREGHYSSIRMNITGVDHSYDGDLDVYDGTNNFGIAYGAIIENAIGGSGNDILTGNDVENVLVGGAGNDILDGGLDDDTLNGGAGTDMVSFKNATAAVSITLHGDGSYNTAYGNDTFISIEGLLGSNFNDTLTGDSGDNFIEGGLGDDMLDGGIGTDTVSYQLATVAVTVNLSTAGAQNTSGAGTDTLSNFENILGSGYNDTLTGNGGDNILTGGQGDDTLTGGLGHDTFMLSNIDTSSIGGLGNDKITDFKSNLDDVFDANEDVIDLSSFFSVLGILVDATNITDYLHMSESTPGKMSIDRDGLASYSTLLNLTGSSNIFYDADFASLLAAGQIIV